MSRAIAVASILGSATSTCLASEPVSQCLAGEAVLFSCRAGTRLVSLCATGPVGAIGSLAYRAGAADDAFVATSANGNRFYGTVAPSSPGASVRQVWFDRGGDRVLLTQCVGASCPHEAGLTVLRGDRILSNEPCDRTGDDRAWFSGAIVKFGSDPDSSESRTELLQLKDDDNAIDRIYAASPTPMR